MEGKFSKLLNKLNNFSTNIQGNKYYIYVHNYVQTDFHKPGIYLRRLLWGPFNTYDEARKKTQSYDFYVGDIGLGDDLIKWVEEDPKEHEIEMSLNKYNFGSKARE